MLVSRKKILFFIICIIIDISLAIFLLAYKFLEILNPVIIFLIVVEFYIYYLLFVIVRDKKYSVIEKLYRDKASRYKNLYIFFSELYNKNDTDDMFLIRTIKVDNSTDKIVITFLGAMLTLFTLLYDNFEKILLAFVDIMLNLFNVTRIEIKIYLDNLVTNNARTSVFFTIIFLLLIFSRNVNSFAIKTYVNYVIKDLERDRSTYNSHGISNNEIIINSLESE